MAYTLHNAHIVLVDDMTPILDLTRTILLTFGFNNIHVAQNGEEGFELVCKHDPDLVITDWMMEPVDGLELTSMIRRNPGVPNPYVPILIMTGFSSRLRVESARDQGITEFMVKPFSARDLYARIVQIIEKPRQFVDAENFFGPDRRRRLSTDYEGPLKRRDDKKQVEEVDMVNRDVLDKLVGDVKKLT